MNNDNATFEELLREDPEWEDLTRINERWAKDSLYADYHKLSNKHKGILGEWVVASYMEYKGSVAEPPLNPGHDRIIDGYKTEIKFALAVSNSKKDCIVCDKFMINHIAESKDWERLIFVGINPPPDWDNIDTSKVVGEDLKRMRAYYMTKEDFVSHMAECEALGISSPVFKHQQSGEKGGNDDYMVTNFSEFVKLPFVKEITEW